MHFKQGITCVAIAMSFFLAGCELEVDPILAGDVNPDITDTNQIEELPCNTNTDVCDPGTEGEVDTSGNPPPVDDDFSDDEEVELSEEDEDWMAGIETDTAQNGIVIDGDSLCQSQCQKKAIKTDIDQNFWARKSVRLNPYELPEVFLTALNHSTSYPTVEDRWALSDIQVSSQSHTIEIVNSTPRSFKSILIEYGQNKDLLVLDLSAPIGPYSKSTFQSPFEISEPKFIETAEIWDPNFALKGEQPSCDLPREGADYWACRRHPVESEMAVMAPMTGAAKWFFNSRHFLPTLEAFGYGSEYLGLTPNKGRNCVSPGEVCSKTAEGNDTLLKYFLKIYSKNYNLEFGILETYGKGWIGLGSGWGTDAYSGHQNRQYKNWMSQKRLEMAKGPMNTFLHEMGHAYGFSHQSGFTYGYADFAAKYIASFVGNNERMLEDVPSLVFRTAQVGNSQAIFKVFKRASASTSSNYTFEMISKDNLVASLRYSELGGLIQVKYQRSPQARVLFKMYSADQDLFQSTQLDPGIISAHIASTDTVKVLDNDTITGIAEANWLGHEMSKTYKGLYKACGLIMGPSFMPIIPSNQALVGPIITDSDLKDDPTLVNLNRKRGALVDFLNNSETLTLADDSIDRLNFACLRN